MSVTRKTVQPAGNERRSREDEIAAIGAGWRRRTGKFRREGRAA